MKLTDKIQIGYKIIQSRLLGYKVPLVVSYALTNKCNLNCKYCAKGNSKAKELKTPEIFTIIDELKNLGTKILSYTGGETLLRSDIREIIDYTHKKGIYANINTNGTLFLEKINQLDNLYSVRFSLDGPKEINDYVRGQGTFQKVVAAIKAAKKKGFTTSIVSVLSKYNLSSVDYLIDLAEQLGVGILFQPVTLTLLNSNIPNQHIPDIQQYKNTIAKIIKYKKKSKLIFNTRRSLFYLQKWPEGECMRCYSSKISCRIETDGNLYHCGRRQNMKPSGNCLTNGAKLAFNNLSDLTCKDCWCALRLETNYIASLGIEAIASIAKRV